MSPQGRLVVLPDSGHLVQFDRPDAIVQAVP
jgi:pimeloyl-ACP methyl ester carboxylesterase